jgi:septal ring factor EnvC (AmiA/AmiB activator)
MEIGQLLTSSLLLVCLLVGYYYLRRLKQNDERVSTMSQLLQRILSENSQLKRQLKSLEENHTALHENMEGGKLREKEFSDEIIELRARLGRVKGVQDDQQTE